MDFKFLSEPQLIIPLESEIKQQWNCIRIKWVKRGTGVIKENGVLLLQLILCAGPPAFFTNSADILLSTQACSRSITTHIPLAKRHRVFVGARKKKKTLTTTKLKTQSANRILQQNEKVIPRSRCKAKNRDWFWVVSSSCSITDNRMFATRTHTLTHTHAQIIETTNQSERSYLRLCNHKRFVIPPPTCPLVLLLGSIPF